MPATIPENMPVTLAEAKAHLRVTHHESDTEILDYLLAAIEYVEIRTGRVFRDRTLTLTLDDFPGTADPIEFIQSPVSSVTTVQYYDADNSTQTHTDNYLTSDATGKACLYPTYENEWPETSVRPDAVTITYVGGYGGASSVPARAKQAIKMLTRHGYDHRDPVVVGSNKTVSSVLPLAAESMIRSLKPGNYPNP